MRVVVLNFLLAVVVAAALGSIVQTQYNLGAIQAIGAEIPFTVRAAATLHDLWAFAPLYAVMVAVAFLVAFPAAWWVVRRRGNRRVGWFAAAGAVGILAAFIAANFLAPMPTVIGATRGVFGSLAMMATAAAGAALFAFMVWRRA